MNRLPDKYFLVCLLPFIFYADLVFPQRISFGLFASDGIMLETGSVSELDFNSKQPVIFGGNSVSIALNDQEAGVIVITGKSDLDVTVSVDAPLTLDFDENNQVPLNIGISYCNLGALSESAAKQQAVNVPPGFTGITFPVLRGNIGPPGPPPSPDSPGSVPAAVAYLFIYGILGPVPSESQAGEYNGTINIYIEYSTYN